MNYILFDGPFRMQLLPFTFTRPVADIRIGISTIRQKWEGYLKFTTSTYTEEYLSQRFPTVVEDDNIFINASYIPVPELVEAVRNLQSGQGIFDDNVVVAYRAHRNEDIDFHKLNTIPISGKLFSIKNTWDIFLHNAWAIAQDFELLTHGLQSQTLSATNTLIGDRSQVFVEEGAIVEGATLNTTDGPIYIGKFAQVMEGSLVRGPFALCDHGVLKMGAKIYGGTTIGPYSKVGGEVSNSVIFGYSNKGHDGFLGNSVLGEWCNLGADTNTSNLKNNYAPVRLWNYKTERFEPTGQQFCGLMMGDHSKCGINTMFNTGTVVGVSANIFGSGFPRNFIPSYSWGGSSGMTTFRTNKAFEVAQAMMGRRNIDFTTEDEQILTEVFEQTQLFRNYDK